jgi:hypothetical protein
MGPAVGIPDFFGQPLVKIAEPNYFALGLRILIKQLHVLREFHYHDQVRPTNKIIGDRCRNMRLKEIWSCNATVLATGFAFLPGVVSNPADKTSIGKSGSELCAQVRRRERTAAYVAFTYEQDAANLAG